MMKTYLHSPLLLRFLFALSLNRKPNKRKDRCLVLAKCHQIFNNPSFTHLQKQKIPYFQKICSTINVEMERDRF